MFLSGSNFPIIVISMKWNEGIDVLGHVVDVSLGLMWHCGCAALGRFGRASRCGSGERVAHKGEVSSRAAPAPARLGQNAAISHFHGKCGVAVFPGPGRAI